MPNRTQFADLDVVNQALTAMGETRLTQPLASDDTPAGIVMRDNYAAVKEAALSQSNWRFATVKLALNLENVTPPNRWAAQWNLPADMLKALYIWPPIKYELQNGKLLTNIRSGLVLDYIRNVAEGEWPPWFTRYCVSELVLRTCKGITGDDPSRGMEAEQERALANANYQDAQQQPNQTILPNDFIDVRH